MYAQGGHFLRNFDVFSLGQSDTYTIPENLRRMVSEEFSSHNKWNSRPMYLGGAVVPNRQTPEVCYCGGGAGYVLNAKAVEAIVASSNGNHNSPEWSDSANAGLPADRRLAACLQQQHWTHDGDTPGGITIQCAKTTYPNLLGALRFLEFDIDYHTHWNKAVQGPIKAGPLANHHAIGFHLVNGTKPLKMTTTTTQDDDDDDQPNQKSQNEVVATAMRGVHAIVRGHCTDAWKQPITAKDQAGNTGYVADPTILQRHPLPFSRSPGGKGKSVCSTPFGEGLEGAMGYWGLQKIQKILIHHDPKQQQQQQQQQQREQETTTSTTTITTKKKVLCSVYMNSNRHDPTRAIAETYGVQCDGFLAAYNQMDPTIGAVNLLHQGPEACK
jgi:hypothetical protein